MHQRWTSVGRHQSELDLRAHGMPIEHSNECERRDGPEDPDAIDALVAGRPEQERGGKEQHQLRGREQRAPHEPQSRAQHGKQDIVGQQRRDGQHDPEREQRDGSRALGDRPQLGIDERSGDRVHRAEARGDRQGHACRGRDHRPLSTRRSRKLAQEQRSGAHRRHRSEEDHRRDGTSRDAHGIWGEQSCCGPPEQRAQAGREHQRSEQRS